NTGGGTPAIITFKQVASAVPQATQATVTATYAAAQTVGDLNVVIIGWNTTSATVSSVTDTRGNVYALAIGPTQLPGQARQSIHYAPNIAAAAAGANTGTVSFSGPASFPDLRTLEYSGIGAVNPLQAVSGSSGKSSTSHSGTL